MFKTILLFTIASLLFSSHLYAQAANTTEASLGDWYKKLRESPLSLSYSASIGTEREKNLADKSPIKPYGVTGIQTSHFANLGLRLSPNDSVSIRSLWLNAYGKEYNTDDTHFFTDFNYSRRGILNQEAHGINLSASLLLRIRNDQYQKRDKEQTNFGQTRAGVSISRTLTENLSFSSLISYGRFLRNSSADKLNKDIYLITPTLAYQLSTDWSISFSNTILHINKMGPNKQFSGWDAGISLGYSVNSYLSLALSASSGFGGGMMRSRDGSLFTRHIDREMIYALEASISAF